MAKPLVLFIHGYGATGGFCHALRAEALDFQIATLTLPAPRLPASWDINFYAKIVREHIAHSGWSELIILGHSLGAAIISLLADVLAIKHFILLSPLHPQATGAPSAWLLPTDLAEAVNAYAHLVNDPARLSGAQLMLAARTYLNIINTDRAASARLVHEQIQNATYLRGDLARAYVQIASRATLIIGANDAFILPEPALALAKALGMPSYVIAACGHAPIFEQPAQVAALLNAIMARLNYNK